MSSYKLGKYLALIIVLFPILFSYSGGFPSFSLADMLLIIWFICVFTFGKKKIKIPRNNIVIISFVFYLYLVLLFEYVTGVKQEAIMKLLRYLLYFTTAVIFAPQYLDYDFTLKVYKISAIATTAFLFLQIFSYYVMGKHLMGYIPFLPLMGGETNFTCTRHL